MSITHSQIGQGPTTPVSLLRWRASADSRRRALEGKLLGRRLNDPERENLMLWLRNLETRETWARARLEHIVAMKRILTEAIAFNEPATPVHQRRPKALVDAEEEG